MKLVLGLIALAQAGTWKRSSDDEPVVVSPAVHCAIYNYDMYAAETDGVNRILPDDMIFEARMDNDTCILTMYPNTNDEHEAPLIDCDCSNPTDFVNGMEEDPDLCEEVETLLENQEGYENFKRLICGDSAGESAEDEPSVEALCYLFNYERFNPGPDYEGDYISIFGSSVQIDDSCDDTQCYGDFCTLTEEGEDEGWEIPCNCNKPDEFIKNMLNKDVCEEAKKLAANPEEGMNQAGLDNFESLVCGFQTNILSFGLILLCTLFKF